MKKGSIKAVNKEKFEVEVITKADRSLIYQLMCLEERCLPIEMRHADSYNYYLNILKDAGSINMLLKYKRKIIGFIVARAYRKVYGNLANHDPDLRNQKDRYFYIDMIQINPHFKINGGLSFLITKMVEKAIKRNISGFCLHARKKNGLSQFLQKIFHVKKLHSIDNWLGFNEQFDYLEMAINKKLAKRAVQQVNAHN